MKSRQAETVRRPIIQNRLDNIGSQRTEEEHSPDVTDVDVSGSC